MGNKNTKIANNEQKTKTIKEGQIDIQYGYKANILSRYCVVTATELLIYSDHSLAKLITTVPISSLLNIDVNHSNTEYFQILFKDEDTPIINIHCRSKQEKASWVSIFENICPITLLTRELQTVKNCARNMGFKEEEIEIALVQYHNKYSTLYNVHEFIGFFLKNRSDTELTAQSEEKQTETEDFECAICGQTYTDPVRNIHDKVYCLECIKRWFDMIKDEQKQIRDPYTQKPLPQHCRLLIPHFSLMVRLWNHTHSETAQISETIHKALKNMDKKLDEERKKVLQYLLRFQDEGGVVKKGEKEQPIYRQSYAAQVVDVMMRSDDFMFNEKTLNEVLTPSMECYQCFITIQNLIKQSSDLYNNAIKEIFDNRTDKKHLFHWKEPKWNNFIDKNCIDWPDKYQVEERYVSDIFEGVQKLMKNISTILKSEKDNVAAIKDKIIKIVLQQQVHYTGEFAEDEEDEKEPIRTENEKFIFCDMERILYSEKHGRVNTRCITDIARCMKRNKPFELYHNDINSKSMTRDQLVRFLQTGGIDGVSSQYHMYKNLTFMMKDKLWKLSHYLKTKPLQKNADFPYFRYIKRVESIDPKHRNAVDDKIALKVTLDLDYDEHLEKYNKRELGKILKKQLMKYLKLKCADKYVQVTNIQKGSIKFNLTIHYPITSIIGGLVWFGYDVYKYNNGTDYMIPCKNTMTQGALVGGGIGILAAKCAAATFGLALGASIGIVVGGIILGAALGYGAWRLFKRHYANKHHDGDGDGGRTNRKDVILHLGSVDSESEEENIEIASEKSNSDDEKYDIYNNINNRNEPGAPSVVAHFSSNVMDLNARIERKDDNEFIFTLDCGCNIDYNVGTEQYEGNAVWCKKCKKLSSLREFKTTINSGDGIVAVHSLRNYDNNFGDDWSTD